MASPTVATVQINYIYLSDIWHQFIRMYNLVFFISLDKNGALFAKVICDIPILHIIYMYSFRWKSNMCRVRFMCVI